MYLSFFLESISHKTQTGPEKANIKNVPFDPKFRR